MDSNIAPAVAAAPSLLVVDDDEALLRALSRALAGRGFNVRSVSSVQDAMDAIAAEPPSFAAIDLSLRDGSGLEVAQAFSAKVPDGRFVMMSGYGDISNAVAAVKCGALDFLIKPFGVDDIVAALTPENAMPSPETATTMNPQRVRWEHIQSVFQDCRNNVSETARRLQMHRRTLQRILAQGQPC